MTATQWIDLRWASMPAAQRDRIDANIEELQERQAIVDLIPPERTLAEIAALEARARIVLDRPESFQGEHYCAKTLVEQDITRWRAALHANGRHFRKVIE